MLFKLVSFLSYLGFFFLIVMFGLFFTTVTLGLDPGVSSLSSSGAFFFIVILGRNASEDLPYKFPCVNSQLRWAFVP